MDCDLLEARYVRDYIVWLKFHDGTDVAFFRQFRVDPECETLVWPNGADFAPEFLHDNIKVTA